MDIVSSDEGICANGHITNILCLNTSEQNRNKISENMAGNSAKMQIQLLNEVYLPNYVEVQPPLLVNGFGRKFGNLGILGSLASLFC